MKKIDLCKRVGLVALCVVMLCTVIGMDGLIGGLAAGGAGSATNTKEFNFANASDLDLFEMWYAPTLTPEESYPAIAGADSAWEVSGGVLKYKGDASLYHDANTLRYNENDITQDFKVYSYKTHNWGSKPANNIFDYPAPATYKAGTSGETSVANGGQAAWPVKDLDPNAHDARGDAGTDTVESLPGTEGRSRDFGYLDFAPWYSKDDGYTSLNTTRVMTHNHTLGAEDDFVIEVDMMVGLSGANRVLEKGVMIAPDGGFAFSNDGDATNDTGLFISYYISASGNFRPVIIGAIDPSTATATSGQIDTDKTKYPLKNAPMLDAANTLAAGNPIGLVTDDYRATAPQLYSGKAETATAGKISMAIEVKDGKLSVWNPYNEKSNKITVDLNQYYGGGNVSLFATSTWQSAFAGLRVNSDLTNDATKEWDYSYSATRNATVHNWNPETSTYTGTLVKNVIPTATASKNVTYKSKDNVNNNYAIAVLNAKKYGNFTLEMDVKGGVMVGFGANNTAAGVFPAQQNGGYAFLVNKSGAAKLIGYGSATAPWSEKATGTVSSFSATTSYKYKVVYNNGTATLYVNNTQIISQNVGTGIDGHIYLAANTEGAGIANLKVTGTTTDTYPLDKVQQMQSTFDFWYMPVGNATEEVPAYNMEDLDAAGNWYIDNKYMYFAEDHELFEDAATLTAGFTKTVKVDASVPGAGQDETVLYKSADDEIDVFGNYAIAMLKTAYTDFRLEVTVSATEYVPYIGFGAKGGHYGAHVGQSGGGYAFMIRDYSQVEGVHSGTVTPLGSAKLVGFNTSDTAGQKELANKKVSYDVTKAHTYVIEVVDKKVTVKVDGVDTGINTELKSYAGGYIYLASNNAATGFSGLKITDLSEAEVVTEEPPVDLSKTVKYSFSDDKALDDFKSYFVYSASTVGKPAHTVNTATDGVNWYVDDKGFLTYQANSLQKTDNEMKAGFDVTVSLDNGGTEQVTYPSLGSNPKWNANMGVAMLNTRTYENFIMDVDFRATPGHFHIGFGAKGGNNGIMQNNKDGGYALHIKQTGTGQNSGIFAFEYNTGTSLRTAFSATREMDYSAGAVHHLRIIVSDGVMYAFLDDATEPIKGNLPNYTGGYIFFALNSHSMVEDGAGGFDNLQITDLDAKQTKINTSEITARSDVIIDRGKGEELTDHVVPGQLQDCEDVNGYTYTIPVTYSSDTYRSYDAKTHAFKMETAESGWHNFVFEGAPINFNVTSKPEDGIDPECTRKYYFDHINDLNDFVAYAPKEVNGVATTDGKQVEVNVFDEWSVSSDGKLINPGGGWTGHSNNTKTIQTLHTLYFKDLHLYDFHYQFDYTHPERDKSTVDANYWWTYQIIGNQDPTVGLRKLSGSNMVFTNYTGVTGQYGTNPGIWFWTALNRTSDTTSPTNMRVVDATIYYAGDVYAYEKRDFVTINNNKQEGTRFNTDDALAYRTAYVQTLLEPHTTKVTMVSGQFGFQVDDSPILYRDAQNEAIGGYIGLGTHYHGTEIDNLIITALDKNGQPMKFADAKQGMAPSWNMTGYAGWDASESEEFVWDPEVYSGVPTANN
ncbi:MAG: hypothetical protein IJN07_05235 [Clostridia bacterium]|nr:hypothetical protein [Clostridia bacterium]